MIHLYETRVYISPQQFVQQTKSFKCNPGRQKAPCLESSLQYLCHSDLPESNLTAKRDEFSLHPAHKLYQDWCPKRVGGNFAIEYEAHQSRLQRMC